MEFTTGHTLTFELIVDSRFEEVTPASIAELCGSVSLALTAMPEVSIRLRPRRYVTFKAATGFVDQYKVRCFINKSRSVTWEEIKRTINEVRPMVYAFV